MKEMLREVKKRLYAYPKLDGYISDYEEELRGIQDKIKAHREVGASSLSLSGVRGSDVSDPTLNKILKIDALQEEYEKRINYIAGKVKKYYAEKQKIEEALELLSAIQRQIIEHKYFLRKTWEEVREIDDMMSTRYFRKEGGIAVRVVAEKLYKKE